MKSDFEKGNSKYSEATELREAGQLEQSIETYIKALEILTPVVNAPLRICLLYDLALAYDFSEKPYRAIETFEAALELYYQLKQVCPQDDGVSNLSGLIEQIHEQIELATSSKGSDNSNYICSIKARPWSSLDMPVKVYIDSSEEKGYESDLADFAYAGFSIWLDKDINLDISRTTKEEEAQIKVYRVSGKLGPAAGQTLFKDDTSSDGRVWLKEASIRMYSSSRKKSELSPLEEKKFFSLACHEAGHALGLDGHSPFGTDLMYFKSPLLEPSSRDYATLKLLYFNNG